MDIEITRPDGEEIENILQGMHNSDPRVQLSATESFLKIVEADDQPIATISRPDFLHTCLEFITMSDNPDLQLVACKILANLASLSPGAAVTLLQAGAASRLVELLRSPVNLVAGQALWTLAILSENGPGARNFVWQRTVLPTILNFATIDTPIQVLRNIMQGIQILIEIKYSGRSLEVVGECLSFITQFLPASDTEVVASTCSLIAFLIQQKNTFDVTDNNQRIQVLIDAGVDRQLMDIISKNNVAKSITSEVLKAISNMATGNNQQREHLLELGCLPLVARFLNNPDRTISQLASRIAANICAGGNQNHIQVLMESEILPELLKLMKTNVFDREPALAVANIALYGSNQQIRQLIESIVGDGSYEILIPFCLLLYTDSLNEISVVLQSLENLLRTSTEIGQADIMITIIHSAQGVRILRKLQDHLSCEISVKVSHLLATYFSDIPLAFFKTVFLMIEKKNQDEI